MDKNKSNIANLGNICAFLLFALLLFACAWAYQQGLFSNIDKLRAFVDSLGWAAPIFSVLLHLLQILLPFIPGGIVLTAVVVVFGAWRGFIINFLGIILGSTISFALARHFGQDFVRNRVKPEVWHKYFRWLDNEKVFRRTFFLIILLPFAPDDALCMLAGLSKISNRDFMLILIFAKIPMILLYSLGIIGADSLL